MKAKKFNYTPIEEIENEECNVEAIEDTAPVVIGVVSNCDYLNVREYPDTTAKIISLISNGDEVQILEGANSKFYKSNLGYVMKDFITLK